jgi:hypothetical protein
MSNRILSIMRAEGFRGLFRRGTDHQSSYTNPQTFPQQLLEARVDDLSEQVGLNMCINGNAETQFDPQCSNILLLLESPAVVKDRGWVDPNLEYDAEISFEHMSSAPTHLFCHDLYINYDAFVEFRPQQTLQKNELVSMIYSFKSLLPGQALRHEIAARFRAEVDLFGTGYDGQFVDKRDSLDEYMFQVVVENGLYPHYVSEKLFDCIKTRTIPIYRGGVLGVENLGFDTNGIISFETLDELEHILANLSKSRYVELSDYVDHNFQHLHKLRTDTRLEYYYNQARLGYMNTPGSYFDRDYSQLNIHPPDE